MSEGGVALSQHGVSFGAAEGRSVGPVRPRLAVLTDFPDEGWPSMDLCGDMLLAHLPRTGPCAVEPARVCPPFRRLAGHIPAALAGRRGTWVTRNADRWLNRFVHFPRHARRQVRDRRFDLYHVADHTYAQLVHELPRGRAGVFCHDLDAFRCLLEPARERRPRWFRAFTRRILTGLQRAAVVFHSTEAVGRDLVRFGVVAADRLVHAPYGVAPEFTFAPGPAPPAASAPWLRKLAGRLWVAHVGSCIPRKRIDVLLEVVAAVRRAHPGLDLGLVKVGGAWSTEQEEQIARLGLGVAITHVVGCTRSELATVYNLSSVVLVPSEAEGFGLPVVEALACGAPVLGSDIAALREAGGPAALYAPAGDVAAWSLALTQLLTNPATAPARDARLAWAARFSWAAHAETIAGAYHRLLDAR
jgi:glycosyltransferase involved in cell wall biosynthesis